MIRKVKKFELWDEMTTNDLKLEIAKADGVDLMKAWREGWAYESQLEDTILSTLSELVQNHEYEGNISDEENNEELTLNTAVEIASRWNFLEAEEEVI